MSKHEKGPAESCGAGECGCAHCHEHKHDEKPGELKVSLVRVIVSAALLIIFSVLPVRGALRAVLLLVPYLLAGYDILREAAEGIFRGDVFDENFLMAVATVGALALGDFTEAAAVMIFYKTGELFEDYAVGRSRGSIEALMDLRADYADVERNGETVRVDPNEVAVGEIIVVRPGGKIPIDGVVAEGSGALDTSALTGESLPRDCAEGDEVISGSVSLSGVLRIRTAKPFGESTVSRILALAQESSEKKSRSENFITRFARVYTPAVCYGALALALLPPAARGLFMDMDPMWGDWIKRALTFLVISCPCALVISVPLGFFGGLGGASRQGVLIKGSSYLEALGKARTVVFDKTGTLTKGVFAVSAIVPAPGFTAGALLEKAALCESWSDHPISRSLISAWGGTPDEKRVTGVRSVPGKGVCAAVDGVSVAAGSGRLMDELGIAFEQPQTVGTAVHVAVDGAYAGHIVISDEPKPTSRAAVDALRALGVQQVVMLTGDTQAVADDTAARLGLDRACGGLMPADKVALVEELLPGGTLCFVGDGVNDAPVLARADVGVAMGALGSDAAIEAADVVLMDDDPAKVALAVRISRRVSAIVRQNIVFAIGVKAVCLILGAMGLASMWLAIFADVGVMVLAVLNSMRTLRRVKL